ncbi:hypothetical protein AU375_06132 [Methylobacterium radiotolerans]|nr:hypothetical protein AU375_06132 [Methylobacterium radiotolerans]
MSKHHDFHLSRSLHRIAALLGVPVEDFYERQEKVDDVADARECLRLWSLIRADDDRKRVLAFMRDVVDDEQR